ncbi:hypothetical protein FB107DRAFT_267702 [Schizophyllum commune]
MAWCPTSCDELALVLSDKTVQVYKWPSSKHASMRQSNRLNSHFHPRHTVRIKYCPSGDRLALTTGSGIVEILDVPENKALKSLGVMDLGKRGGAVILAFAWQDRATLVVVIRTEAGGVHIRRCTIPDDPQTWNGVLETVEVENRLQGIYADVVVSHGKVVVATYDAHSASVMVQRSDGTLRVVGCGFEPPPVGFPPVTIIHGGLGIILWKDGEVHLYDVGRDLVAQRLPGSPSGVLIAVDEVYEQLVVAKREQGPLHRITIYRGDLPTRNFWTAACSGLWMCITAMLLAAATALVLQWSGYDLEDLQSAAGVHETVRVIYTRWMARFWA